MLMNKLKCKQYVIPLKNIFSLWISFKTVIYIY